MTAVAFTEPQHTELLNHARTADPTRRGRIVGAPITVAQVEARVPVAYDRVTDGTTVPPGWSVSTTYERDPETGEVELTQERGWQLLDTPGAEMSVATRDVLLAGVGERGPNRRFSLRFRFDRFGDGR